MSILSDMKETRRQIKYSATRFKTFLSKFTESSNLRALEDRLADFKSLLPEFNKIQLQIEISSKPSETELAEEDSVCRENFEEQYYDTLALAGDIIEKRKSINAHPLSHVTSTSQHPTISPVSLQLPIINLPKFNGQYTEWTTFHDSFKSIIHENNNIALIEKFHYLKSCLTDEARRTIDALPVAAESYVTAWSLLTERYQNKRLIVQQHMHELFHLHPITNKASQPLRALLDGINTHLAALKSQGIETDSWDAVLIYLITSKFDFDTKRDWDSKLKPNELPTFRQLREFLTDRCLTLESIQNNPLNNNTPKITQQPPSFKVQEHFHPKPNPLTCPKCRNGHSLAQCHEFINMPIQNRINETKRLKVCFNCLRPSHDARSCRSSTCRTCSGRHHTLLHVSRRQENVNLNQSQGVGKNVQIMLSTALVPCKDGSDTTQLCRAILDQGSQQHLITSSLCKKLNLNTKKVNLNISGVCESQNQISESAQLEIGSSYQENFRVTIDCLVVPKINSNFPQESFEKSDIPIPANVSLADCNFNISSSIDLLIGAALFWDLLRDGRIKLSNNQTFMQNTILGWILGGPFQTAAIQIHNVMCCNVRDNNTDKELHKLMERFWEMEDYDNNKTLTTEEKLCEDIFYETHERDADGKFVVRLPFKTYPPDIGNTKRLAVKRFYALERKFKFNPSFKVHYQNFINEYLSLGHMQLEINDDSNDGCYLPHHGVIKRTPQQEKFRVVFDGSCKSDNGTAINDHLLTGQNLQKDIFTLLVRFRQYQFAFSSDVIKMFRNVLVHKKDRKFQKIIWRSDENEQLHTYHLTTCTYGLSSSPYIAMKCLQQLAKEFAKEFPHASQVLLENVYMDDIISGHSTLEEAIQLRTDIIKILQSGGFSLSKWASNSSEILPASARETNQTISLNSCTECKTLGLNWKCESDMLKYEININTKPEKITKRTILSMIASIYDPISLLSPIFVQVKLILQQLWQTNCSWDDPLPVGLQKDFEDFLSDLPIINKLEIPRKVIPSHPFREIQLHGFSDASGKAYGAVIYIRVTDLKGRHSTNILCSKARIAPIKPPTIPRMELCAAVLLAKLARKVKDAWHTIPFDNNNCFLWTDSTIVLAWIASSDKKFDVFVNNRLTQILNLSDKKHWKHISGDQNPADIVSRGMNPTKLQDSELWWRGPPFLNKSSSEWPITQINTDTKLTETSSVNVIESNNITAEFPLFKRVSSYSKLKRIIAYCFRFINNCRKDKTNNTNALTPVELEKAEIIILKIIQREHFAKEIDALKSKGNISTKSSLKTLCVFLDVNQVLRVGGRIQNTSLPFKTKHQILLPKGDPVTKLIIRETHINQLHAGAQGTLAAVRQSYWPIAGKNAIRKIIHSCVKCYKTKPIPFQELMGNLPSIRVTPARPFLHCGVDYAGPLQVKLFRGRMKTTIKCYVAVFVCLTTKAIHLELVYDYTAESFLNALKRMMARRGRVQKLISDNGTNFVGANRSLQSVLKSLFNSPEFQSDVVSFLNNHAIEWKFIPANSPYMGGIWEAGVKSFKSHFKRVVGSILITMEEMHTLLTLIESCLNSRPITPMSNDPNDLESLTSGHFLIGAPLTAPMERNVESLPDNRLTRWQRVEKLRQLFWRRWHKEYLTELQRRNKWQQRSQTLLKEGSLVILKDDNLPPLLWRMGRIVRLHTGIDGMVRVVSIKTSSGVTKRGVNRVCVLPVENDESVDRNLTE